MTRISCSVSHPGSAGRLLTATRSADATMTASRAGGAAVEAWIRRVSVNTESETAVTRLELELELEPEPWHRRRDRRQSATCVAPGRLDHFLPIEIRFHCLVHHLPRITKIGMESVAERKTRVMRAITLLRENEITLSSVMPISGSNKSREKGTKKIANPFMSRYFTFQDSYLQHHSKPFSTIHASCNSATFKLRYTLRQKVRQKFKCSRCPGRINI